MLDPRSVAELAEHFTSQAGAGVPLRAQQYEPGAPTSDAGDGVGDPRSSAKIRRLMFDPSVQARIARWRAVREDLSTLAALELEVLTVYFTPSTLHEQAPELWSELGALLKLAALTEAGAGLSVASMRRKLETAKGWASKVRSQADALLDGAVGAYSALRVERERAKVRRREELLEAETVALRRKLWGRG